jgi:hypothetical protein
MSERNDTVVDLLRALGFVVAVVLGGLLIGGVLQGWNETGDGAPEAEEPAGAADD